MPSSFRDPKSLPEWLELDYYQRVRPLRRLRRIIGWTTLLACLGLTALLVWRGNRMLYQAGPVSSAHAMFNNDCALCHAEMLNTTKRILPWAQVLSSVPDQACQQCHLGAIHNQEQAHTGQCVDCHQEHRGMASLAHVPDKQCTACHADLKRKDGKDCSYFARIGGFDGGRHPEFAWFRADQKRADPGTVRFNHKLHLDEKGILDIDTKQLEQLWKGEGPPERVVTRRVLECRDCHQPDAEWKSMQPVRFDQHCQSCHGLNIHVAGDFQDEKLKAAAKAFALEPLPHPLPGQGAETVRAAVRDRFVQFLRINDRGAILGEAQVAQRPWPGFGRSEPLNEKEYEWVNRHVAPVEHTLFNQNGGCKYCHQVKVDPGAGGLLAIVPASINRREFPRLGVVSDRWFPSSFFSHKAHRMVDCTECHKAGGSSETSDVLMPGIQSCLTCHSPQQGVRSDCIECHLYHNRTEERKYEGKWRLDGPGLRPPVAPAARPE